MTLARRVHLTAVLGATLGALSLLFAAPSALCQTPPGYEELFQDPPRSDQLTQADLPNLGRLVALEATSMFVHARSELRNSPDSALLLEEISTLWNAADAFTAASTYPLGSQRIQAGRLTFPELEEAFYRVKATLGRMPGIATRAAENFYNMSRVVAVIKPLLELPPTAPVAVEAPRPFDPEVITNKAHVLSTALVPLKTHVKSESERGVKLETLENEIGVLEKLIEGFERISSSGASERDLVASFWPIRVRAQRINRELQRGNLRGAGLSLWRAIEQQINDMETRFQIPREIVPRPAGADTRLPDLAALAPIDLAVRDLDGLVDRIAAENPRPPQRDRVQADARRLITRLLLTRQFLLGQVSREQVNLVLVELEMSWRQLESRMSRPGQARPESFQTLAREVNAAIARTREQIVKPR